MSKHIIALIILTTATTAFAAETQARTYTLTRLQKVEGSNDTCKKLYTGLQSISKKPIVMEFSGKGNAEFDVKHQENQLINHTYRVIQQAVSDGAVTRFGMGTFELDKNKMDYVITISADLKNKHTSYTYPMIIANHTSQCVFTAALKPDQNSITAFKKNIKNKNLDNGADLMNN